MAMYSALDIGRWFIARNQIAINDIGGDKLTLLKLLKLLYYAEGCSLALNGESLFDEPIVAWEHGPVVVEVYDYYDDAYDLKGGSPDHNESVDRVNSDPTVRGMLEQVFNVFGQYSAWALRNKTHEETPWIEATQGGKSLKRPISRDTMKEYFQKNYVSQD